MQKYRVALVQMNTVESLTENLNYAERAIREAASNGADLIVFPEVMNRIVGESEVNRGETLSGITITRLSKLAAELGVWVHCGSLKEVNDSAKPYNTTVLLDDCGSIAAIYRKLHLFDADVGVHSFRESDRDARGNSITVRDTPFGKIGLAICYDLRFPELFRIMALMGAEVVILAANFTYQTGQKHWCPLIKARAIENGFYFIAVNQTGVNSVMHAYGHSMAIDPWGNELVVAKEAVGIYYADVDRAAVERVRKKLPSLKNRRSDIYNLSSLA